MRQCAALRQCLCGSMGAGEMDVSCKNIAMSIYVC